MTIQPDVKPLTAVLDEPYGESTIVNIIVPSDAFTHMYRANSCDHKLKKKKLIFSQRFKVYKIWK